MCLDTQSGLLPSGGANEGAPLVMNMDESSYRQSWSSETWGIVSPKTMKLLLAMARRAEVSSLNRQNPNSESSVAIATACTAPQDARTCFMPLLVQCVERFLSITVSLGIGQLRLHSENCSHAQQYT